MSLVKCTELRMEGRYLTLTAETGGVGPVVYRLGLNLDSFDCMRFDELRMALKEIEVEVISMQSACNSTPSAIYAMRYDWRESLKQHNAP